MQFLRLVIPLCLIAALGCGGASTQSFAPTPTPAPPTVTGNWTGSGTSTPANVSFPINGSLKQGVTNPDGSIQFSGTLFLPNSCISTITITSGLIAGTSFALSGSAQDGTKIDVTATLNAQDTQLSGKYSTVGGTICLSDFGTFSLTKQ